MNQQNAAVSARQHVAQAQIAPNLPVLCTVVQELDILGARLWAEADRASCLLARLRGEDPPNAEPHATAPGPLSHNSGQLGAINEKLSILAAALTRLSLANDELTAVA